VTWPAIHPKRIFLQTTAKDAAETYHVGDVVDVVSDPHHPTRARLVGFEPDPRSSAGVAAGALFPASGYLKWWRWLVLAHRDAPPTPPGRHRAHGGQ